MNKKILVLLLSGMMIVPTTGCNARLTIGGKEVFNFSDKGVQQENVVQNDKEVKDKENNKTNKAEEKKETEEKYCDWCEDYADHSTDEHMAQCYDCGEYKKAKDMEFNGRSFHCGCVDEEPTEELLICPNCGGSYTEDDMIEDTENGVWYCYGCYDEIMYDRMGGDSNGDYEEYYEEESQEELYEENIKSIACPNCGIELAPNGKCAECGWGYEGYEE